MTHDEMISVIQAHKEGKRIESNISGIPGIWVDAPEPCWDFNHFQYRIAREPRKCWVNWDKYGVLTVAQSEPVDNGWQLVTEQL